MTDLEAAHVNYALDCAIYASGRDPRKVVYEMSGAMWAFHSGGNEMWFSELRQVPIHSDSLDHDGIQAYLDGLYERVRELEDEDQ